MTKTEIYQLPQWEKTDRVLMEDFNEAFAQVEASIPRIAVGTYVGTGTCRTVYTSLEIGFAPKFILVLNEGGSRFIRALSGTSRVGIATSSNSDYFCNLEWTETGLRWINTVSNEAGDQLNQTDMTYRWLAIG